MVKILVIRFSSIGDIVLTTPAIRCLKQQIPNASVFLATKWDFRLVTASNPNIDGFVYLRDDFNAFVEECRSQDFDIIVDLHNNYRSARLCRSLGLPSYTVNKLNTEKFMLTALKMDVMPDSHFTFRCLETIKPLGVTDDGLGLDYFIPETDRIKEDDLPMSHRLGYIALVIGATHATKRMPADKWKELAVGIRHPVVLLGGPGDKAMGEQIVVVDPVKIYNACGKFNINESADLVRHARFVISHDTGLMHIAAAFQKPIIAVWGNTDPRLGMYPYYGKYSKQKYWNAEVKLWCRPCSKIGFTRCPLIYFGCMNNQDIPAMIYTVHKELGIR